MRIVLAVAVVVFSCLQSSAQEGMRYFSRGPRTTEEEFFLRHLDTDIPALRAIPDKVRSGDLAAAEQIFAAHVRSVLDPSAYLRRELAAKPTGARLERLRRDAAAVMDYRLSSCGTPHHFADHRVDWEANPTFNKYREWTWQLSRHSFLSTLAHYYLATRDERATETWMAMLGSWFDQATLPPDGTSGYATHCWRNIEAGIRMPAWAFQLHAFLSSPKVDDRFLTAFFRSVWEHGHRMTDVRTFANWRQHELMGLVYIGELFGCLRDARAWRDYALGELEKTFAEQVYPDGFQYELTTGYHCVVINNYESVVELYRRLGREEPRFLREKMESMYAVAIPLMLPSGNTPALNDGGKIPTGRFLSHALKDYPCREDFRWFATGGKEGKGPPDYLSTYLPYAGGVVFRSSWARDAVGAYMDCSPFGSNHQHEDKLNFLLEAYGKPMVVEPGSYDYDTSEMRRYVVNSHSHNTLSVNGQGQRARRTYKWYSGMISNRAELAFSTSADRDWCAAAFTAGYGPGDRKTPLDLTVHSRKAIFHKDVPSVGPFFVIVDRLKAPDAQKRTWESPWHLETTNCRINGRTFTADFGDGVCLFGAVSDSSSTITDRRGQKTPYWQGWMPIHKSGPHEHRPIATPVVEGSFEKVCRIVTVLVPYKGAKSPVVGVVASSEPGDRSYEIRFAEGTAKSWREPNEIELSRAARKR